MPCNDKVPDYILKKQIEDDLKREQAPRTVGEALEAGLPVHIKEDTIQTSVIFDKSDLVDEDFVEQITAGRLDDVVVESDTANVMADLDGDDTFEVVRANGFRVEPKYPDQHNDAGFLFSRIDFENNKAYVQAELESVVKYGAKWDEINGVFYYVHLYEPGDDANPVSTFLIKKLTKLRPTVLDFEHNGPLEYHFMFEVVS